MAADYPDDADGNALRRIVATGANMSKPMDIDFQIAAPDEVTATRAAEEIRKLGYRSSIYGSEDVPWRCQCTRSMVPAYASLIAAQAEVDAIARLVGARADGWGTYGQGKKYMRSGSQPEPAKSNPNSLWSLLALIVIAFGLLRVAFSDGIPPVMQLLAGLAGLLLWGGVTGAAVGHEVTQNGRMARRGAIIGAIIGAVAFVVIAALLYFAVIILAWRGITVAA